MSIPFLWQLGLRKPPGDFMKLTDSLRIRYVAEGTGITLCQLTTGLL